MKNYSQNKEQEVILNYFKSHVGTFCDIGANDGITLSNTRALFELGWKGIFIEPDPNAFKRLKNNYAYFNTVKFYNYAICDSNSKRMLQTSGELLHRGDVGLVSTFHASEMDRFKHTLSYEPSTVQCFTWRTALNRWKIKTFDMISLDVEGSEMEILPDIDLSKTQLLCIEHNSSEEKKKAYLECTSKYGINNVIYESPENIIVCR